MAGLRVGRGGPRVDIYDICFVSPMFAQSMILKATSDNKPHHIDPFHIKINDFSKLKIKKLHNII